MTQITFASLVDRRVRAGSNRTEAECELRDTLHRHSGDNLAAALLYLGYATPTQAQRAAANPPTAPRWEERECICGERLTWQPTNNEVGCGRCGREYNEHGMVLLP